VPNFYPEGNTVLPQDNELRTLHKIADLLGGGSGGAGGVGLQVLRTSGNPEGVLTATTTATRGAIAYDPAVIQFWKKNTVGTSNTGWEEFIGP